MAVELGGTGNDAEPEWPSALDVAGLIPDGWRPAPFSEFVLKINSRCDLACDHCYIYEMADQSWRDQPRHMSSSVLSQTARRIAEHVRAHELSEISLILHGGEPLLAGPELLARTVTTVRKEVGGEADVRAAIQTNGARLDADHLRLFDRLEVKVGVSLDGDVHAHDRHRRYANGRGSHAAVSSALNLLTTQRFRHLFSGLLCTVDLQNDPLATYEALLKFQPPAIDFLLPHGNWTMPPPGRSPHTADTPYADWLIMIFDRWYRTPGRQTRIRLFGEIMQLLLGAGSATEAVGLSPVGAVVVATDGSIEQSDTLKSAYDGAAFTGLHVARDSFDDALGLPSVAVRQLGETALAGECRSCRVRRVCGGGLYAHRYRAGKGFANPSVYCLDLFRLIGHIRQVVSDDLAAWRLR